MERPDNTNTAQPLQENNEKLTQHQAENNAMGDVVAVSFGGHGASGPECDWRWWLRGGDGPGF